MKIVNIESGLMADDKYIVSSYVHEAAIAALYNQMVADGTADTVWYETKHTLLWLLDWTARPENGTILFLIKEGEQWKLCGAGWVTNKQYIGDTGKTKAEIGFTFMKGIPIFDCMKVGRLALKYMAEVFDVDYFFGTTPESNKRAVSYAKRMGLSIHGPVPNFCSFNGKIEGVYLSHITADDINKNIL